MPERCRQKAPLALSEDERETLERWSRRRTTAQALALPSRVVLESAKAQPNGVVVAPLRVVPQALAKWRCRFVERRLVALADQPLSERDPCLSKRTDPKQWAQ